MGLKMRKKHKNCSKTAQNGPCNGNITTKNESYLGKEAGAHDPSPTHGFCAAEVREELFRHMLAVGR